MMFYERKGGNKVDTHLEEPPALPKIDAKHRVKATVGK